MKIRCNKCNKILDLKTRAAIKAFLEGIPIKCKCGYEIYKEDKTC